MLRRLWNLFIILGMVLIPSLCIVAQSNQDGITGNTPIHTEYLNMMIILILAGWIITAVILYLAFLRQKNQKQTFQNRLVAETKKREQSQQNILEISDREQLRIGHELHDGVVHDLTALGLAGDILAKEIKQESPLAAEKLKEFIKVVDQCATKLRDLAKGLSPVNIDEVGICGAIEQMAKQVCSTSGVPCNCECNHTVHIHNRDTALHLYRIIQEAVNNAVRHSHAKQIFIKVNEKNGIAQFSVIDDGGGFDVSRNGKAGMGIHIMRYRAEKTGADFQIQSALHRGTTVTFSVPNEVK